MFPYNKSILLLWSINNAMSVLHNEHVRSEDHILDYTVLNQVKSAIL